MDDILEILTSRRKALLLEVERIDTLLDGLSHYLPSETQRATAEEELNRVEAGKSGGSSDQVKPISAQSAAQSVLEGVPGEFLHYADIAERAIDRGYRNPRSGKDIDATAKCFLDVMRRMPHKFARRDRWYFRIAGEDDYQPGETTVGRLGGRETRAIIAERMIRELGRPVSTTEIADKIEEMGVAGTKERKLLLNSIYNAMARSPVFTKTGRGRWGLAESLRRRKR